MIPDKKDCTCIDVNRIYDCCKDRDCMMDLRVYLTQDGQALVDRSGSFKAVAAEVLWTYVDVEPLQFNRGFYTVDIRFFFRVLLDVYTAGARPTPIDGLCTYTKRVILFGSEGGAKMFSSVAVPRGRDMQLMLRTNLPKATVEVVDPVVLGVKTVPASSPFGTGQMDLAGVPEDICACFETPVVDTGFGNNVYVTLGLFSIVRLMREVQIVVPCSDFCVPEKECTDPGEEDPCGLFRKMCFPTDEFFPPRQDPCACDVTAPVSQTRCNRQ